MEFGEREILARDVVRKLQDNGYEAYFAGGAVRDRLLGLIPKDVDVATQAGPDEVSRLFERSESVGKSFGVVLVSHGGSVSTEVATFRRDGPYSDGRRPDWVQPASARQDVCRRDFTINAMLYDPIEDRLLDWVGGQKDLEAGVIRCVGEPSIRFKEDALRMFRAIRFAARFGFRIHRDTEDAIKADAGLSTHLAPERVRDELTAILRSDNACMGLRLLEKSGLLKLWLPEVACMSGVKQDPEHHPEGDVFEHSCALLDQLEQPSASLAWAGLLHDAGKVPTAGEIEGRLTFHKHAKAGEEIVHRVAKRLKFSTALRNKVAALVARHMQFLDFPKMRKSTAWRFLALDGLFEMLALHKADCLASNASLEIHNGILEMLKQEPDLKKIPEPLISGKDLLKMGYRPGPLIGRILEAVCEGQLEEQFSDKKEALRFVARSFPLSGNRK